jgi:hypothetical protein
MVAPTEQPALTPEDLALLASLCDPASAADFAQRPDLAPFLDRPDVQAQLAAILTIRDIRYSASLQAANLSAIASLQAVIAETTDLTEKRRAAASIVRTVRSATSRSCHRGRLSDLGAPRANAAAPRTTFRSPSSLLNSTPGAPPPEIPPHFKRINTFVYSETPSRSLNAKQAVANALALLQQGDDSALQALFNHCTHRARFEAATPEAFQPIARQKFKDQLEFQAAFAAPLIQTERQRARQDVIIIPRTGSTPGQPLAFTIHLHYPMNGDREYCWLISGYTECRPPLVAQLSEPCGALPGTHPPETVPSPAEPSGFPDSS